MKLRTVILFLLAASIACAQTKTSKKMQVTTPADVPGTQASTHSAVLTWTLPTTCTDGNPCVVASGAVYKLVGTCSASTTQFTKIATVGATIRTYTDSNLAAATAYCYYVTASVAMPPAWDPTVTYTGGQAVSYQNVAYVALNNANPNLNQVPSTATTFWQVQSTESGPSNTVGGFTGPTGPPSPPQSLVITVQ